MMLMDLLPQRLQRAKCLWRLDDLRLLKDSWVQCVLAALIYRHVLCRCPLSGSFLFRRVEAHISWSIHSFSEIPGWGQNSNEPKMMSVSHVPCVIQAHPKFGTGMVFCFAVQICKIMVSVKKSSSDLTGFVDYNPTTDTNHIWQENLCYHFVSCLWSPQIAMLSNTIHFCILA